MPAALLLVLTLATGAFAASPPERTAFLLHGILRSERSMRRIEKTLTERGFRVVNLRYPSTSRTIEAHSAWLAERVKEEGRGELFFVGHSLGSVVIRHYLALHEPPQAKRFVMIAPPNRGSRAADGLARLWPYRWIFGSKAGLELRASNRALWDDLPPPPVEFGILAGGRGNGWGLNPFLRGDDDGTVAVDETKLDGAADYRLLPLQHSLILLSPETARLTAEFLETGRFAVGDGPR